jgi:hypothetical protein
MKYHYCALEYGLPSFPRPYRLNKDLVLNPDIQDFFYRSQTLNPVMHAFRPYGQAPFDNFD